MDKFKQQETHTLSSNTDRDRDIELASKRKEMQIMQIKLEEYTKQEVYDYKTAKSMLTEIQQLYRIYEAEELFGTTSENAVIH